MFLVKVQRFLTQPVFLDLLPVWTSSCTTVRITAATGGCVLTRNFSMGLKKLLSQSAYMVVFLMSEPSGEYTAAQHLEAKKPDIFLPLHGTEVNIGLAFSRWTEMPLQTVFHISVIWFIWHQHHVVLCCHTFSKSNLYKIRLHPHLPSNPRLKPNTEVKRSIGVCHADRLHGGVLYVCQAFFSLL